MEIEGFDRILMMDDGVLDLVQAKEIAADWLYNNPNRIYKLGLPRYEVS